jgi:hypothetical protein
LCSRAFPRAVEKEIVNVQLGTIPLGVCHVGNLNLRATSRRNKFSDGVKDRITYSYVCDSRRAMTRIVGGFRMQVAKIKY